ncbi:TetR/AcrR family transcriptional regulator [Enterococcus ratti]|uniref:TetR family transcriptional regulator n=1 Tax=Enterococcus ratti TaxID=150033 RepID=A0A1L8WDW6_9ENTE|nr:TetR/AcrR family transcriptional regulator [Enterococcus ratti]OJG79217.1 TetR family transcriptional regulator [Enterococcus ratti]
MARKKTITKDQILAAAFEVATSEGFSKFTARNIANKMNCSTQPIYLEFKNMEELKQELLTQIYDYLKYEVFPVVHTGNTIIDLAFNYINFAIREKNLYNSLYLEENGGGREMQNFSYNYFVSRVKKDPEYAELSTEQIEKMIQDTIHATLKQKEPIEVN